MVVKEAREKFRPQVLESIRNIDDGMTAGEIGRVLDRALVRQVVTGEIVSLTGCHRRNE